MFKIKTLSAHDGDCFIIKIGGENEVNYNILVDGGRGNRIIGQLKAEIATIIQNGEKLDYIVLTHTDNDHIWGILEIFNKKLIEPKKIGKVLFNSREILSKEFLDIIEKDEELLIKNRVSNKITYSQQESLYGWLNNEKVSQNMTGIWIGNDLQFAIGDAIFKLLSPSYKNLEKLYRQWDQEFRKSNKKISRTKSDYTESVDSLRKRALIEDTSVVKGSSISFSLEFLGKKILMLADSHPSVIVDSLINIYGEREIDFDLVKVSHHGSKFNTSDKLLETISCTNYLISTSPQNSHGLPNKESLSRIVFNNYKKGKETTFFFNYKNIYCDIFTDEEIKFYKINFIEPNTMNEILEIDIWQLTEN